MALHRLTNEAWGFTTNCFVCEPRNEGGLRIPFHHDAERNLVAATFELDEQFSGAPRYVHGGVSLAVLDEAQSWATIACAHRFAVTTSTSTTFHRPVRIGRTYRVEAEVTDRADETLGTTARILEEDGRVCAESSATFAVLSEAQAVDAIGTVEGDDTSYLR